MKILVIGGVAGGATTATRLRRLDEKSEIIIFDRGDFVSFANCGLPYYVGNIIKSKENLLLKTPESFKERFNIDVRLNEEVVKILREDKKIQIRKKDGNIYEEDYDKLVLSPGAEPINPFKGLKSNKIKTLRTVNDAMGIKEYLENNDVKNIAIIGGGYIGIEMAENLRNMSKDTNITILEKADHLIGPLDQDMSNFVRKALNKNNINTILNNGVKNIIDNGNNLNIILDEGSLVVDFIILCIGVKPEIKLAIDANLNITDNGRITVNEFMQTSDCNIYALGDAIQVINPIIDIPTYVPLAGPANKQARIVANNIYGKEGSYKGTIGTSILKVFDNNLGIVGINELTAKNNNINYKTMIISPYSHATYYPGATQTTIKAIYDKNNGKILGAQIWGKEGVDKLTDILAVAIKYKMNANDLADLELSYAPPFSSAKSPINLLGNAIQNELDGMVETITWSDLLKQKNAYILDVRTEKEFNAGHLDNVKHIPLDELRENLEQLPFDTKIYVYCHTGLRSYIATRILKGNNFNAVNILGGFYLYNNTICLHNDNKKYIIT